MPVPFREVNSQAWQQYQKDLSTTQLLQPVGSAIEAALGLQKDYAIDKFRYSIKAKFPGVASQDALTATGAERGLPQGPLETVSAYAARLRDSWNAWLYAGTAFGMLRVLYQVGYTNVVIGQVRAGNQFTLGGSGTTLLTTTNGSWTSTTMVDPIWSRFDVMFPQPLIASWVSGGVPSSSSTEANFIRSLISSWKPAHSICTKIAIQVSGKMWGYPSTQNWGSGTGNWGGVTTVWSP